MEITDTNGKPLQDGDSVILTQDLKLKGSSSTYKRGTVMKNIRIVEDDSEHVLCRDGKTQIYLKTKFIKKK